MRLSFRAQVNRVGAGAGPSRLRAFTMLEVLLVIGLITLLSGVLVTGAMHLFQDQPVTPEDVFWKAAGAARKQALLSGRDVRMFFVSAMSQEERGQYQRALVVRGVDGKEQRFPFPKSVELSVDFLVGQSGASMILVAGQVVETQAAPYVTFYGDGTCSPFRVQIRSGGPANILSIDPWTCAQVLKAAEGRP